MAVMAALPAIAGVAGLIGKLFGGAAKGSADQRQNEYQQNLQRTQMQNNDALQRAQLMNNASTTRAQMQNSDALARAQMTNADQYNRAGLDLQRRAFAQQEPNSQARQALTGSLLSRLQPLQMSGLSDRVSARMPKMNSIIDSIGPDAREAGSLLAQRGLGGLQSGPTKFDAIAPMSLPGEVSLPDLPNLPPATIMAMQKSGLLEKILGGVGLTGSIIGGLGQLGNFGKPTSGNGLPVDEFGGG